MKLSILLLFSLIVNKIYAQTYVIHGFVQDSLTGETLIGASVIANETNYYAITNNYGFYSIRLKQGTYNISYNYAGYKPQSLTVVLNKDTLINIALAAKVTNIDEVVVKGSQSEITSATTSKKIVDIQRLKSLTTITGEADVLKSLQLLPGVQTANEGTANFNVRGGTYDQNLVLLDEAPVYNPSHTLGFFSTFNPDALKSVTFYKGYFPSQYGGRLSSVVDISMKDGNKNQFFASGGIGLLASRISVEGPLYDSKVSYIISGRYGYPGQTLNLLAGKIGHNLLNIYALRNFSDKNEVSFYDLNIKLNYQPNSNNRLYLSLYNGQDHFYSFALNSNNTLDWGNFTTTVRWNHIFSMKFFANYTLYFSKYNYAYFIDNDLQNYVWQSGIREIGVKADHSIYFNNWYTLKWGVNVINRIFSPGNIRPRTVESLIKPFSLDTKYNDEFAFYLDNDIKLSNTMSANIGVRQVLFIDLGPAKIFKYNNDKSVIYDTIIYGDDKIVKSYTGTEPRMSVNYVLTDKSSIKISYSYVHQYLHLLSNSSAGLPTDLWLPADNYIKPQSSHQYVIGYYASLWNDKLSISIENYYKKMQNIIDFKDNADLFLNKHIETEILQGIGYSYGTELLIEKKIGNFKGWLSYCLSKTQYKIEGINESAYYSPRFDIRHSLSITSEYVINNKWSLSSTFKLTSGGYATIPAGTFIYNHVSFPYYIGRNGYKLPPYHRLDLSIIYKPVKNNYRKFKSEWVFGLYNVYNHKNVYALYVRQNDDNFTEAKAYYMYLFGIVPTVTYNFNF
ncbi:MAG: TonB-dependent receptor [Bacteroidales bacterium]|nr:TonB-dependent receptor [Bacteroidales bacterium]